MSDDVAFERERPVILLTFANDRTKGGRFLRNLKQEEASLRESLAEAESKGLCEVVPIGRVETAKLFQVFRTPKYRDRIAIFHFAGHAQDYDLLLETPEGGTIAFDGPAFADFLSRRRDVKLVFLNGCSTQPQVEKLLDAGVAAVIATSLAINDATATDFASHFYAGLASGFSIHEAFQDAISQVRSTSGGSPRGLYVKSVNGQPVPDAVTQSWPWRLFPEVPSRTIADWNLPAAVDDPIFRLPPLPADIGYPPKPYRNLNWFTRDDARVFFGRGHEIRELYQALTSAADEPVILYHGQSGVGKSSLLAADLLPRLEGQQRVAYARIDGSMTLLETAARMLHTEAEVLGIETPAPEGEPPDSVGEALRELWLRIEAKPDLGETEGKPFTLILDQIEEAYTQSRNEDSPQMHELAQAIGVLFDRKDTQPRGHFVLSFRKEWLANVAGQLGQAGVKWSGYFLERITRNGIIDAITGPARKEDLQAEYHLSITAGLARDIASELDGDRNSAVAPTLQILLDRMWEGAVEIALRMETPPAFTPELYQEMKTGGHLLGNFLDRQIHALH